MVRSDLAFLRDFLVEGESGFQVIGQGRRMIEGAGVQPEALGVVPPDLVDGPLEEKLPESLADEARHEAKLNQLDVLWPAAVQLRKPGRSPLDVQHLDFVPRVLQDGGQL